MISRIGFTGTGFKLFQCQAAILRSQHRITVATTGRGVGKSVVASHWVARRIFETGAKGLIGSPTYGQTNEILTYLIELLHTLGCETTLNKMPPATWNPSIVDYRNILTVLPPGADACRHVHVASTDNFEALRGRSIGWMLLDEAALINEDAYYKVLLPALRGYGSSHNYMQLLTTSPRGSTNWVSKLAKQVGVLHVTAPSWQNIIEWPEAKIEEYRTLLSDLAFRQEIAGEIIEIGNTAMAYAFRSNMIVPAPDGPPDEIWLGSDQNVSPMVTVVAHRYGPRWWMVREAVVPDSANVEDMVSMLCRADFGLVGKRVILTGDSSGNARTTVSRKSFYDSLIEGLTARRINVVNRTLKSNPPVFKSMEELNALFQRGELFITPECRELIVDLEKARYTPELTTDKKYHDPHACFTFETPVLMGDGSTKAIGLVKPGEVVMTPVGPQTVVNQYLTRNDIQVNCFYHQGHYIGVTDDHEFARYIPDRNAERGSSLQRGDLPPLSPPEGRVLRQGQLQPGHQEEGGGSGSGQRDVSTPSGLAGKPWTYTRGLPRPPHRRGPVEQPALESGAGSSSRTPEHAYAGTAGKAWRDGEAETACGVDTRHDEGMARLGGGEGLAPTAREGRVGGGTVQDIYVSGLWEGVRIPFKSATATEVLSLELQDGRLSGAKSGVQLPVLQAERKVADVYCLSVPCGWFLLAGGLVVKNCDCARYIVHAASRKPAGTMHLGLAK